MFTISLKKSICGIIVDDELKESLCYRHCGTQIVVCVSPTLISSLFKMKTMRGSAFWFKQVKPPAVMLAFLLSSSSSHLEGEPEAHERTVVHKLRILTTQSPKYKAI